jgi:AraC family transcriptional regulator
MTEDSLELTSRISGSLEGSVAAETPGLLARLVEAAAAASLSDREKARSRLQDALALLTTSPEAGSRAHAPRGGLAPWQARRVAAYVHVHIGTSLRTSELAKLVRLSYSHFNRAFKVSFQETPTAYIMRQRMRLAQDKMLTTGHPLSRVALECGLCDQAHFSRMFRRIVGESPRLWRRQFASDLALEPKCEGSAAH